MQNKHMQILDQESQPKQQAKDSILQNYSTKNNILKRWSPENLRTLHSQLQEKYKYNPNNLDIYDIKPRPDIIVKSNIKGTKQKKISNKIINLDIKDKMKNDMSNHACKHNALKGKMLKQNNKNFLFPENQKNNSVQKEKERSKDREKQVVVNVIQERNFIHGGSDISNEFLT